MIRLIELDAAEQWQRGSGGLGNGPAVGLAEAIAEAPHRLDMLGMAGVHF